MIAAVVTAAPMMAVPGSALTPTRLVGLASYGAAALASAVAWFRLIWFRLARFRPARRNAAWQLPMVLTFIHSLLFLDIAFNLRWRLHHAFVEAAISADLYQGRTVPQTVTLTVLGLILLTLCVALIRRQWSHKGLLLALLGTGFAIASWCVEVISLHVVDVALYETKEPFMPVTIIWILVGLMTTIGITLYSSGESVPAGTGIASRMSSAMHTSGNTNRDTTRDTTGEDD